MKLSELIAKLTAVLEEHGDLFTVVDGNRPSALSTVNEPIVHTGAGPGDTVNGFVAL